MIYWAILFSIVLYFVYKKDILHLKPKSKSGDTKRYILEQAKKKYENKEINKEQYEKIINDINS